MPLKTLDGVDIKGKTILYRSPYDIGVEKSQAGELVIKDDSRIKATLPTLNYLIENQCKIVILTWVKRPDGRVVEDLRTTPHAKALSSLLGREVKKANDCVGDEVQKMISQSAPGELLMLENVRFHPEEEEDNDEFAQKLVQGCEFIVFDGFPQAHRAHSSTTGILRHLPAAAGYYFVKEVTSLEKVLADPEKPLTLIIGGAKISDKVDAINHLLDQTDFVLLGGGAANVFLKAEGKEMANSLLEDNAVSKEGQETDWILTAKKIWERAPEKIQMPMDLLVSDDGQNPQEIRELEVTYQNDLIPPGFAAFDVGSDTIREFFKIIMMSKTVFWSGPLGLFETKQFSKGTTAIAKAMEIAEATTIIAGGDTIEAAKNACNLDKISHVSLAGGATLEFLAGRELPVIKMLQN